MTADVELLPLPAEDYVDDEGLWEKRYGPYSHEQMEDHALANVAHATEPLKAEIEALRAEVERWRTEATEVANGAAVVVQKAEARAERLAETLQKLAAHVRPTCSALWDEAQAALRDHDQEVGNG